MKQKPIPKNGYGNVEVERGLPKGCVHVPGAGLSRTCRALGIEYAPAVVGFEKGWHEKWRVLTDGVVIRRGQRKKLLKRLEENRWDKAHRETKDALERVLDGDKKKEDEDFLDLAQDFGNNIRALLYKDA